jgi:hypothetical protein
MRRTEWVEKVASTLVVGLVLSSPLAAAAERATLRGDVVAADRTPLAGAKLWAGDVHTGALHAAATNAADGTFEIDLAPARYELAVEHDGGLYLVAAPIDLAPGQARDVRVAVSQAPVPDDPVAPADPAQTPPSSIEVTKPTLWDNPLTAALLVVGGAIVVGLVIEEVTDDEDEPEASPFVP